MCCVCMYVCAEIWSLFQWLLSPPGLIMSSSLWTSILSLTISTGLLSAQSRMHITVKVGPRAVLPCDWRTLSTQLASSSPHVQWRTVDETVFERLGAEMFQGERYKDRADVPEDKLQEGDCSLVLKKVTHDDAGVYMSYLIVKRKNKSLSSNRVLLQTVELSVEALATRCSSCGDAAVLRLRAIVEVWNKGTRQEYL
ncbi:hypothetical protein NFI96_006970 [Prochilodus magdalenae]|nr:hypothetical protein NFI96_006970 [Prochilodus magdalenae]